jgi:RimJ/RimL family protein N-acetyltransferase/predicted ester cyclase
MVSAQPLGTALEWRPARRPDRSPLEGRHVLLRALDAGADADALYAESHAPAVDPGLWTYLPGGPYRDAGEMRQALEQAEASEDPLFFTLVLQPEGRPAGVASYLRITPEQGVIEIGHIWFGASLRRTSAATEAIYLLAAHAFDELGYRRLEWKCNAFNEASRRAAERFGFRFEGVFLSHMVVKGRNRDTAWYAMTDEEWPDARAGFRAWLDPGNFDADGAQRRSLAALIGEARRSRPREERGGVPERVPDTEANKRLVRRFVEKVIAERDPDAVDELAAGEFAQAARRWVSPFQSAFPDFRMEVVDLIAEGDTVVGHFRCSGTHRAEWLGVPATGRSFEDVDEIYIFRVKDGRVVSALGVEDNLTRLRQLGIEVGSRTRPDPS